VVRSHTLYPVELPGQKNSKNRYYKKLR